MSNQRMHPFNDEYNKHVPLHEQYRKNPLPSTKQAKPLTIADVLPNFDRWSIGYTNAFKELQELAKAVKNPSYPPYNITKLGNGKFTVEIALAGFRKEDLSISVEERTLTVSSETPEDDNPKFGEVLHHGIAQRDFKTTFALAEYVEVKEANLQDGILTIKLEQELPEEKKPKYIEIN